jgi:hypothetical protein
LKQSGFARRLAAFTLLAAAAGLPAQAAVQTFTSRQAFLLTTGSADVNGALPNSGFSRDAVQLGGVLVGGVSTM